ncbi:MAG: 1-deoxy-D-xylulose-5-phosphate synthase, partial [Propionibacteriaceae bacterium]|nr:1-deoxy-D-xylulose-5-phosphate synthase [Propionibacteriaceae bacterium]
RIAVPRDEQRLQEALRHSVSVDSPTLIRFGKGLLPPPIPALRRMGDVDVLKETQQPQVLIVSYGLGAEALSAAEILEASGIRTTVADPVWAMPISPALIALAARHSLVVTVEDGLVSGGLGTMLAQALTAAGVLTPVREVGIPQVYLRQGSRSQLLAEIGLTPEGIAAAAQESYSQVLRADCAHDYQPG